MTYVVAGVTGNTGSVVASTLLQQRAKVRVLVRSAEKGESFRKLGAEVAVADLADESALTRALEKVRGAYLLLPTVHSESVLADQAKLTETMAAAIERARVPHVVFLSSIGAHLAEGTGPIMALRHAEQRLGRIAGTVFTFLRPAYFMENFGSALEALDRGVFQTFIDPERKFPVIAAADIGKTAARCLVEGASKSDVIELSGPVDMSVREVANDFAKVLGKPLDVEVGPVAAIPDALASAGSSRDLGRLYAEMTSALNAGSLTYEGRARLERGAIPVSSVAQKLLGKE
jgi:uncharacterized protein YbjT (DUF2867 family)